MWIPHQWYNLRLRSRDGYPLDNQVSVFIASVVGKINNPKMNLDSQGHSVELLLCLLQPTLKVTSALTENLAFSPARSALHYAINLFFHHWFDVHQERIRAHNPERTTPWYYWGLRHGGFTDQLIFRHILAHFFQRKRNLHHDYQHIRSTGYQKGKLNVIKMQKSFLGL